MTYTSTVTQKGQVQIPKKIRDALKIEPYGKVELELVDKQVIVKPTKDILEMGGFLNTKVKGKNLNALKAREYMQNHYRRV